MEFHLKGVYAECTIRWIYIIFTLTTILSSNSKAQNVSIVFNPSNELTINSGEQATLFMNVSVKTSTLNSCLPCSDSFWMLQITTEDPGVAEIVLTHPPPSRNVVTVTVSKTYATASAMLPDVVNVGEFNVTLRGVQLGRTSLTFTLTLSPVSDLLQTNNTVTFPVRVIRASNAASNAMSVAVAVVVGLAQFMFALSMGEYMLKWYLKKKQWILLLGLICQYICMPPLSYGLLKLFALPTSFALALFTVGCCPGGGMSNLWSLLLDGDLALSALLTLISNIMAFGMMPLWLFLLGRPLLDGVNIPVPYQDIAIALVSLLIPMAGGIVVRRFYRKATYYLLKVVRPIVLVAVIVAICVGIYSSHTLFSLVTWQVVLAGILLPYTGYLLGFAAGMICTRDLDTATTMCVETGMQNTALAIVIVNATFPKPESDIGLLVPGVVTMMSSVPFFIAAIVRAIRRRCCGDGSTKDKPDSKPKSSDDEEMKVTNDKVTSDKVKVSSDTDVHDEEKSESAAHAEKTPDEDRSEETEQGFNGHINNDTGSSEKTETETKGAVV